jgi:hypothetical protein
MLTLLSMAKGALGIALMPTMVPDVSRWWQMQSTLVEKNDFSQGIGYFLSLKNLG